MHCDSCALRVTAFSTLDLFLLMMIIFQQIVSSELLCKVQSASLYSR